MAHENFFFKRQKHRGNQDHTASETHQSVQQDLPERIVHQFLAVGLRLPVSASNRIESYVKLAGSRV